jgi:hypothetical protein
MKLVFVYFFYSVKFSILVSHECSNLPLECLSIRFQTCFVPLYGNNSSSSSVYVIMAHVLGIKLISKLHKCINKYFI